MRILGIDYGDSRIGIAVSDPFGWTAQAVETIYVKHNLVKVIERIKEIVDTYKVEKIVIGFPINMNGTVGIRGEKTLSFIDMIADKINIEIVKWDERLSSVAASRIMHETDVKTVKKKSVIDQIAACYILQGYLDSIKKE